MYQRARAARCIFAIAQTQAAARGINKLVHVCLYAKSKYPVLQIGIRNKALEF